MKLKHSKELDDFFNRCWYNLNHSTVNEFLSMHVTKGNEKYIQKKLIHAGCNEFAKDPTLSLFISSQEWENTPYHKQIHLDHINDSTFSYVKEVINGNELFNADAIQKDPDRELKDWMKLRALDKDVNAIYLLQNGEDWMLDAPSEAFTNDPYAKLAHGNVLTFGLGIGYFLFMCTLNPNVKEITVIERSKEVITMFEKEILPQFSTMIPIHIICADAFDYYNREFLSNYDFIYTDIWKSNDDGLEIITKLLEQYHDQNKEMYFWIEDSCVEVIWTLIFIHFDELYHARENEVSIDYIPYMKKIRKWFSQYDKTITESNELKDLMYDRNTIRAILSTTL